jgi:mono/diheme cytochrome c family protein
MARVALRAIVAAVLGLQACGACTRQRERGAARDGGFGGAKDGGAADSAPLPPRDWAQVAADVYLAGEDYQEAKEVEGRLDQRRTALLHLIDSALALIGLAQTADADLVAEVGIVRQRIAGGVDYDLPHDCALLADRIARRALLRLAPSEKPDLERGAAVYAAACAACHGKAADGKPVVQVTMDPPPADLLHPEHSWRPYDMFARVTYGGLETAMPGFADSLSAQERWDVVFWLFAMRWPPCVKEVPPLSASVLAVSSDFDLSNKFAYDDISCLRRRFLPP